MGHFDTEAEPPLDAVLVEPEVELELELAVEPELEPPALLVLLGLEPVVACGSVGVEASVIGVTVCTHGVGVVGVAGEVALEEVVGGEAYTTAIVDVQMIVDGHPVDDHQVHLFKLRDGRIASVREYHGDERAFDALFGGP